MRLGIDLDGVVADFNAGWMKIHAAEFGSTLRPEDVTTWNNLHTVAGFDDMRSFWSWASPKDHRRSIFRHLDTYPDSVETLDVLRRSGHQIVIVTTKPQWAHTDTLHWLADNGIPTAEVHMTDDKHEVDCDVYLDDAPHVLDDLVAARPHALVCRFVRPWNDPTPGTVDVNGWDDFHRAVTQRSRSA